jgi:uncharacterized SAM-binding protein YcdF (DUF218 family)
MMLGETGPALHPPPAAARGWRRLRLGVAGAALLAALALAGGFAWFARAALVPPSLPPIADGIVALTGGADRVGTALRLLQAGRARVLLISGVGAATDLRELAHLSGIDAAPIAWRVTLGRTATSTVGNAEETAAWAREHDVHSLIVVTAGYHMPRALTELSRALPDVALYPVTVVPTGLRPYTVSGLHLLVHEYAKWLAARLGLTHLLTA